eukprot:gene9979-20750_t
MKRNIEETTISNGLRNHPVKHKKLKQPYMPPELLKLHTLCAFIGHRGSGKTHAMVNLAKRYLDEGSFTRTFIISPSYESNPAFHVLDIEKEDIYDDHHQSLKAIEEIFEKTKTDSDDYDDYI